MTSLSPYPTYKPSGLDWLGDVPAHWELRRLSTSIIDCVNGVWGSDPSGTNDVPCVRVADFDRHTLRVRSLISTLRAITDNERIRRTLRSGDLLLEKSGGGDQQPVGVVILFDHTEEAVCSNFIARMRVRPGFDPKFLTFLHSALYSFRLNTRSIKQTTGIQNLDSNAYLSELVAFPPLPEQTAIVRYLDRADTHIQRYIANKDRLIQLLTERKQAIINQAVTRGLDPNVPLKPSGVEWLGDVPAHWQVSRLRNICDMRFSNVDKHVKPDEIPVELCNYVDVYKNDRINSDMEFMSATARMDEIERFRLEIGDVLITKDSETWDDIAVPALIESLPDDLICGYHIALLRAYSNMIGSYLFRCLQVRGVEYQFHVEAKGVTRFGLSQNTIGSVLLPVPPLPEQTAIVEYLDKATADIDAAADRARRQIGLMREYRTRLIADVVTGKLDVRGAVADDAEIAIP